MKKIIWMKILTVWFDSSKSKPSDDLASRESSSDATGAGLSSDSSRWTEDFLRLKKAIASGARNAVKSFIDFPINSKGNEIWYQADSRLVMEINPKDRKPFREADFEKYFSSIFAIDLRRTLEKVNVEEFFKSKKSASPEIEVVKGTKSMLVASFDNAKSNITLALVTTFPEDAGSNFTVYYQFEVLDNQHIRFRDFHVE